MALLYYVMGKTQREEHTFMKMNSKCIYIFIIATFLGLLVYLLSEGLKACLESFWSYNVGGGNHLLAKKLLM